MGSVPPASYVFSFRFGWRDDQRFVNARLHMIIFLTSGSRKMFLMINHFFSPFCLLLYLWGFHGRFLRSLLFSVLWFRLCRGVSISFPLFGGKPVSSFFGEISWLFSPQVLLLRVWLACFRLGAWPLGCSLFFHARVSLFSPACLPLSFFVNCG